MSHALLLAATLPDALTFAIAAVICVIGSVGVVLSRNPVHAALMLIMTLFGVAVLFVEEDAQFLAAVQVIVYAGAIVVLFLFVIMLLGVDREESLAAEPMPAQRYLAIFLGLLGLAEVLLLARGKWPTGAHEVAGAARGTGHANVYVLGRSLLTTYLMPFEVTSALLVIAVIGAVVLARRPSYAPGEPFEETGSGDAGPLVDAGDLVSNAGADQVEQGADRASDEEGVTTVGRSDK